MPATDFYATTAQILPVLLLALLWESRFLERIRIQDRHRRPAGSRRGVLFWTKPRVRAYAIFVCAVIVLGTADAILVLAGLLPNQLPARLGAIFAVVLALATLLTRVVVDVLDATRTNPDGGTEPPCT